MFLLLLLAIVRRDFHVFSRDNISIGADSLINVQADTEVV